MRIVLINAPASVEGCSSQRSVYFPIALLSLGAMLRAQGIDVRLCVRDRLIQATDLLESPELKNDTDTPHFVPANVTLSDLVTSRETVLSHYRNKRQTMGIPDNQPFRYAAAGRAPSIDFIVPA